MEDGGRGAFCKDSPPHPHKSHFSTLVSHHQAFSDIILLDTNSKNIVSWGNCFECKDRGTEPFGMPSFIKKAIMWVAPSVSYALLLMDPAWSLCCWIRLVHKQFLCFNQAKGPRWFLVLVFSENVGKEGLTLEFQGEQCASPKNEAGQRLPLHCLLTSYYNSAPVNPGFTFL